MKKANRAFLLGLFLVCSGQADQTEADYSQAVEYYRDKREPRKMVELLERSSTLGHLQAKELLAHILAEGEGVPPDESAALSLLKEAADAGVSRAQYNYALLLQAGRGGGPDALEAFESLNKSADGGFAPARRKLAEVLYFGDWGQTADPVAVLPQVKALAATGDSWAQNLLGTMFEHGQGMPTSRIDAIHWYRQAADQGDAKAQGNLGRLLRSGPLPAQEKIEAIKWLIIAAENGDTASQLTLGDLSGAFSKEELKEAQQRASRWRHQRK